MYGYIYKRENLINGKIYIGKHKYSQPMLDESYRGSGKLLNYALVKYGEDNFTYELIDTADTLEELNLLEKFYIEIFNCIHPNGYNISAGGDGGNTYSNLSEEDKALRNKKLSDAHKGTLIIHKDEVHIRINPSDLDTYLADGYCLGVSENRRNINREAHLRFIKENPDWTSPTSWKPGNIPWNKGKPMREDSKEKLRKTNTGKKQSVETIAKRKASLSKLRESGWNPFRDVKEPPNKGQKGVFIWVTNGIENMHLRSSDQIPEGFYRGRKRSFKKTK